MEDCFPYLDGPLPCERISFERDRQDGKAQEEFPFKALEEIS